MRGIMDQPRYTTLVHGRVTHLRPHQGSASAESRRATDKFTLLLYPGNKAVFKDDNWSDPDNKDLPDVGQYIIAAVAVAKTDDVLQGEVPALRWATDEEEDIDWHAG